MLKKKYIIVVIVVILMALFAEKLLFSNASIFRQQQVTEEIKSYQAQIDSLQKVIEQHKLEIERLQNDSLYKESILRTRYGMSQKGEKVFQMVK